MKKFVSNVFVVAVAAGLAFACENKGTDNVDGLVDSTAVTEPTMDEAMNTSGDTATVVRTDSTALQETKQMGTEVKNEAKDATH